MEQKHSRQIIWTSPAFSVSNQPHRTDGLFFARNVYRHQTFVSPFSIKFCLEGAVPYVFRGKKLTLSPGEMFVTNNGTELECLPTPPGTSAVFVFFTARLLSETRRCRDAPLARLLDDPAAAPPDFAFFEHKTSKSDPLIRRLILLGKHLAASTSSNFDLGPDLFFELAELLFDQHDEQIRRAESIHAHNRATRLELFRRLLLARDFLYDNLGQNCSLEAAARVACLSPYHFHRTFREAFGEPPMQFFRRQKMENARRLLMSGRTNVSETAVLSGFSDVAAFSKAFKKMFGHSPTGGHFSGIG
jgi:AraC-like DNA-binding protein